MTGESAELRRLAAGKGLKNPKVLTAKDGSTVDGTYGSAEANVIQNNRTRIEEIETQLKELGILA